MRANLVRKALLEESDNWVAGIMYAVSRLGYGNGKAVKPFDRLSAESKRSIELFIESNANRELANVSS